MKRSVVFVTLLMTPLLVFSAPNTKKGETPTAAAVRACYANMSEKNAEERGRCLNMELDLVRFEFKTVSDQVAARARVQDKKAGNGTRWNKVIAAGQSFENYVKRDCELVETTTAGGKQTRTNAGLACRIGHYRMRTSVLANRHLEQGN